jgi:hypothetical protein
VTRRLQLVGELAINSAFLLSQLSHSSNYSMDLRSNYRSTLTFMCTAAMVSSSLTAASLQPDVCYPEHAASAAATPGTAPATSQWAPPPEQHAVGAAGPGCKVQQQAPVVATEGDAETSPLSSTCTTFVHQLRGAGSVTPSSVDSCRLAVEQHQQQQYQQQARLAALYQQQAAAAAAMQQQQQRCVVLLAPQQQPGLAAGGARRSMQWSRQPCAQQPLLLPAKSSASSSFATSCSSDGSFTSSAGSGNISSSSAAASAWQQLLQHQHMQLQPARLTSAASLAKRSSSQVVWEQPQPLQQPAAKRAATAAAVAAALQQRQQLLAYAQPPQVAQQQLALAAARLPPTGLGKPRQQQQQLVLALQHQAASAAQRQQREVSLALAAVAAAAPACGLEAPGSQLLGWAGRVLACQLQDAYLLASHIFKRASTRLDSMLLISLGVTAPCESVTMLVSLWVATKLEGHRRQVAGASKLAAALQLLPGVIVDVEVHLMQLLDWQPYAGWQQPAVGIA